MKMEELCVRSYPITTRTLTVIVGRIMDTTTFKYATAHLAREDMAEERTQNKPSEEESDETSRHDNPEGSGNRSNTTLQSDYTGIGGLKREIEAVREVVDLAVYSPKLFSDFGTTTFAYQWFGAYFMLCFCCQGLLRQRASCSTVLLEQARR